MRIAYVVAGFPKPSETFVSREILELERKGMSIDVFSFQRPKPSEIANVSPKVRRLMRRVVYIGRPEALAASAFAARQLEARELSERLKPCSSGEPTLRLLRAAAVAKRMNNTHYDGIHAHWPYATQVAMLVHAMRRTPLSVSVHAHEVAHDSAFFPLAFERLDFAAFCNDAARLKLLSRLPEEASRRTHLVYHGVDLEAFAPVPIPKGPELRVLSAGRLTRTKGFDRLIRAVALARERGGHVHLSIAGEGPERAKLASLVAELGVASAVSLLGWVPHGDMHALLARSHVFALMAGCQYHDGLPNVVLEAMASGRPVVVSPLPAAEEAIVPGESGVLLPSEDAVEECSDALLQYGGNPRLLETHGARARQTVEGKFDQSRCADALVRLFKERGGCDTGDAVAPSSTPRPSLSVVTIAKNEERDMAGFVRSFEPWVDEIVICDDGSTDATKEIAFTGGPKVKLIESPRATDEGFDSQRNKAIDVATGDWLLHVDVDMRLTPELAREILHAIGNPEVDVYEYRLAHYFLNRPLFHGAGAQRGYPWLIRSGLGRFERAVHERIAMEVPKSRVGRLHNRMHHLGDENFEERLRKNVQYSAMEGTKARREGRQRALWEAVVRPPYRAAKTYFAHRAILDGRVGVVWALYLMSGSMNRFLLEYADRVMGDREELEERLRPPHNLE